MAKQNIILDNRVNIINDTLVQFSKGNFNKKTKPTNKFDIIDAIMFSLNLLGEEMEETTISKNYFTQIYNNITDLIFEVTANGKIINFNNSVTTKLGWQLNEIKNKKFDVIIHNLKTLAKTTNKLDKCVETQTSYLDLTHKNGSIYQFICKRTPFSSKDNNEIKYLITANDITNEKTLEKEKMAASLQAQETERKRLAKDLHDSIGQQLSAIKLYLGSFKNLETNNANINLISNCNSLVNNIAQEIRNICFDLLPRTLNDAGLLLALKELAQQINSSKKIVLKLNFENYTNSLKNESEVQIYRIIQEFINNSLKHSGCTKITITFKNKEIKTYISITDNGKGFDTNKKAKGLGLYSMTNRINTINGVSKISSKISKGTKLEILL